MISSALRAGLVSPFRTSPQVVHPARTNALATALPILPLDQTKSWPRRSHLPMYPFAPVTRTDFRLRVDILRSCSEEQSNLVAIE